MRCIAQTQRGHKLTGCSSPGSRKSWTGSPMGVGESWTGSPMEPPEKGRRGHTFTHTERALVATFNLSDRTTQKIQYMCYVYARRHTDIRIYIYTYTYTYIYTHAHLYVPRYANDKSKLCWSKWEYSKVAKRPTSEYAQPYATHMLSIRRYSRAHLISNTKTIVLKIIQSAERVLKMRRMRRARVKIVYNSGFHFIWASLR